MMGLSIMSKKSTILSGMRSTGVMHLGHYHGVIKNWLQLQKEYDCYFFAADWHALTTDYADPSKISHNTRAMMIDWLACGIDPDKAHLFIQSHVPEHAELHLLLSMITPISWLERVPTYKDQQQKLKDKDLSTYGFLGYPVLQAADILLYRCERVPVGQDQVAHVELVREIARRFNHLYAKDIEKPILFEPEALLTKIPIFPGLDGQKMSKSYNNFIGLREKPEIIEHKIKTMQTDPARIRRTDPGTPEKCPVWRYHTIYSDDATKKWVCKGCITAGIGCLECKKPVIESVLKEQEPIRKRAEHFENHPEVVDKIIKKGDENARKTASNTLKEVKQAMGIG